MTTFVLPGIGSFQFQSNMGGTFEAGLDLRGRRVRLDINVDGTVTQALLDRIAGFMAELAVFDQSARNSLSQDFEKNEESSVRLYVQHHLDQLDSGELVALLDVARPQDVDANLFLSRIYLRRVGLYPEDESQCALFDYTIGERLTDYVIVVRFDSQGKVLGAEMES